VSNSSIVHTSDATFDKDVLKSDKPVLLDFWAEWCGPCKMIAPILDEIADQYKDKVRIAKLNIDDNPATPPKFNIRGIPTLILFKNGTVEAQKVAAVREAGAPTAPTDPATTATAIRTEAGPRKRTTAICRRAVTTWRSLHRPIWRAAAAR